jgi:hypothetical protein
MEEVNSTMNNPKNSNKLWMWLVIIAIPVGILAYIAMNKPVSAPESEQLQNSIVEESAMMNGSEENNESSPITQTAEPVAMVGTYKDGEYSAVGNYVSPGGPEEVNVSLMLKENVITDVTFESKAERPISVKFQGIFGADYKQYVVGKNIDDVELTKVSGSSLTPQGFNDALAKIKAEAKS